MPHMGAGGPGLDLSEERQESRVTKEVADSVLLPVNNIITHGYHGGQNTLCRKCGKSEPRMTCHLV